MGMATWRNERGPKSAQNTAISWIFDWFIVQTALFDMVFRVAPIHDGL
jgi:hypothetical protein